MKATAQRSNNRNAALLDAAAELFATQGFRETTMRDIARDVGMLPGSIYYHHGSKDDLLLAVYEAGVDQLVSDFQEAIAGSSDPLERLCLALSTHISAITRSSAYMRVVNRVLPEHVPKHASALIRLRDRYEQCVAALIDDLPLAPSVDKALLRMMLLGAVNHTQFWFDPKGELSADDVGHAFASYLIDPTVLEPADRQTHRERTDYDE